MPQFSKVYHNVPLFQLFIGEREPAEFEKQKEIFKCHSRVAKKSFRSGLDISVILTVSRLRLKTAEFKLPITH